MGCCKGCSVNAAGRFLKSNLLMVITLLSVVLGFAIGFALRGVELSEMAKMWLGMPGYCFLNLLRLTILPLITASVITAVATLNPKENGRLGGMQLAYLTLTNVLGATIGTLLGVAIQRTGAKAEDAGEIVLESRLETVDIFADLIRNLFPESIIGLTIRTAQTYYTQKEVAAIWDANHTIILKNATTIQSRYLDYAGGMNILGLMVVCVVFGLAASKAEERGKPFVAFFSAATDIIIIMLQWFIWVAPIGILFLMILAIADIGDLNETFSKVGFFVLSVAAGVAAHQLLFIPMIYFIACRRNPYRIYPYSIKAWLIAFSSTSSACTMPYIYKMMDVPQVRWNRKAAQFSIPVAVALNADGSALYICNAIFFMAQLTGTPIDVGNIFLVWILTVIATLSLPSVPSASLVAVVIVCGSLGIPTTYIGLLFTVEWILDRLRTTSNVLSEIVSVDFINHFYLKYKKEDKLEPNPLWDDETPPPIYSSQSRL